MCTSRPLVDSTYCERFPHNENTYSGSVSSDFCFKPGRAHITHKIYASLHWGGGGGGVLQRGGWVPYAHTLYRTGVVGLGPPAVYLRRNAPYKVSFLAVSCNFASSKH